VQDTVRARNVETKTKVFISYSRKDMAFADKLEAALNARGFEILIDRQEIFAFEDWWKRIEALIGGADTVVFVLSPDAVKSDIALKEVTHAASLNKRFAPIVCRRVEDSAVPEALRRLNFIFFDDPAQFEASAHKLAKALQTDIGWIRRHTEFGQAAQRWMERGRAGGLLLRPPVLDQAEAWQAFRPPGAPSPTEETEAFIAASRKVEVAARRRSRILNVALYTMLIGIILVLVGWMNEAWLVDQWRWFTVTRPYMLALVRPHVLTAEVERSKRPGDSFRECSKDCPEMLVVPAGEFIMGSPASEEGRNNNEGRQHKVIFARSFAVAKFDVTFDDWDDCVAYGDCERVSDPGYWRSWHPVVNVTWDDARRYAAWLSRMTGKPYRMLSEAEFEYAARAGTQTAYPWGDKIGNSNANCVGCGSQWDNRKPSPINSFAANRFGLQAMHGNVWQWTEDCWHEDYKGAPEDGSAWVEGGDCSRRVVRGGSWRNDPRLLRSAVRDKGRTGDRSDDLGFRVGRTLSAGAGAITVAPGAH
jgi:formylglycine-generating enzyme required for sulfatase activity